MTHLCHSTDRRCGFPPTLAEVKRLLEATTCLKHQAALSVAYGAGLRVAEVSALKVSDIDSTRMLLRIERGKGGRYRNAMLPEGLLPLLRDWWRAGRQLGVMHADGWLFPGRNATVPISTRQLYRVVVETAAAADIPKRVGPHTSPPQATLPPCPCCGGHMIIIEIVERRYQSRARPAFASSPGRSAS